MRSGTPENSFIHLWSELLIAPFFLDGGCEVAYRSWDMWDQGARKDSTACLLEGLTRWFEWMRENGVYDNTKIIIAADHGAGEFGQNWFASAVTPLLMVKDFDSSGDLVESDMLMSNSDVLSIICSGLETSYDDVPPDPTLSPEDGRVVTFTVTTHGNPEFLRRSNRFDIVRHYEISGSVHEREGWVEKEHR